MRDEPTAHAAELTRRLEALEEGTVRARAAARYLGTLDPAMTAATLGALLGADARSGLGASASAAVGRALLDPAAGLSYDQLAAVYRAARDAGLDQVTLLLLAPAPARPFQEPRDRGDARLAQLTLGHKKTLARRLADPDLLARLAAEGEPSVVRELLRNPRLTEEVAVRIASRRPCRPASLRCLYEERRWRTRPKVLLALARNPYADTELVLKILPALGRRELGEIATDGALHRLSRALAAQLAKG